MTSPQKNERVTVVVSVDAVALKVVCGHVRRVRCGVVQVTYTHRAVFNPHPVKCIYTVRRNREGQTWARGWEGPAVDALRAALAMS